MKSINKILAILPFTTYSRKVDPVTRELAAVKKAKYIPIIIAFRQAPDNLMLSRIKRIGFKLGYVLPFIKAVSGKLPLRSFETLAGMLEIERIYYDGKASLMGDPLPSSGASKAAAPIKPSQLTGKGIGVAFIDSGVFPHADLTKPQNRIVAFKDFVNGMDFPYDDNGHGTACIGAGFGAAIDGRFRGIAYDANIICAKAFDEFSTGFYSDILAAMQWIVDSKEKHDIRIAVLPFGTTGFTRRFDILSRAAMALWSNGIFVSTCTGNMGPIESSITSPGICPTCFTTGACSTLEKPYKAAAFSSRGPVYAKVDKPDALMPGLNMTTLNSDVSYSPRNKMYYDLNKMSVKYREISGTSVSASLTAAAAALVLQRNSSLEPDDVRSILRACCFSLNELKIVQGAGMIDIKKLEEL